MEIIASEYHLYPVNPGAQRMSEPFTPPLEKCWTIASVEQGSDPQRAYLVELGGYDALTRRSMRPGPTFRKFWFALGCVKRPKKCYGPGPSYSFVRLQEVATHPEIVCT